MTALSRTGRAPLSAIPMAALAGQIGERLEDDAVSAAELPFWRDIAERVAAILNIISQEDEAVMTAIADLARQLDPPAVRH